MRQRTTSTRRLTKEYVDFLKEQVDVIELFEYLGLFDDGKLRVSGRRIVGVCPIPDHRDADNPTAFNFDTEKKLYYCYTKCSEGGDIVRFLEKFLKLDFVESVRFLEVFLGIDNDQKFAEWKQLAAANRRRRTSSKAENNPRPETLPEYRFLDRYDPVPAWAMHLVGEDVAEYFGLRYSSKGYYRHRILWPIHDASGRPVGVTGRTIMPVTRTNPKWLHTPSLKKQHVLFNLHRALEYIQQDDGTVFVVEGPKDVAALWRFGQPNVVALLGKSISEQQIWLLCQYAKRVVILLDNEPPAVRDAARIAFQLSRKRKLDTWVMPLPQMKDPGDIDENTFYTFKKEMVRAKQFLQYFDEEELKVR